MTLRDIWDWTINTNIFIVLAVYLGVPFVIFGAIYSFAEWDRSQVGRPIPPPPPPPTQEEIAAKAKKAKGDKAILVWVIIGMWLFLGSLILYNTYWR